MENRCIMKKLKFVLAFVVGIVATSIFGACSCKRDTNVSVTSLMVSATTVEPIVGDDFTLTYTLTPQAATNKKVYVEFPDGETYVTSKDGYVFDGENSKTITFTAKNRKDQEADTETRIKFSTASGNFSVMVKVIIHDTPTVLSTPQNLKLENGVLSWDAVANAGGYNVLIDDQLYTTSTNEYTPNLVPGVAHIIKVQASTGSIDFADSELSSEINVTVLAKPEITSVNEGTITWSSVENATHYQIVYGDGKTQLVESNVLSYSFANILDEDSFVVSVRALHFKDNVVGDVPTVIEGVPTYMVSSAYSQSRTINRLVAPTEIKIVNNSNGVSTNGILTWNRVEGATNYAIYINNNSDPVISKTNSLDLSTVSDFDYAMGNYTVVVRAEGNPQNTMSGEFSTSEEFSFTKLGYLTGTIDNLQNKLTIRTSDLLSLGVDNTLISKLFYELIFVNKATTVSNDKNHVMTTSNREIILSEISGLKSGEYTKVIIRPYVVDNTIKTLANATKIYALDTISTFAGSFTKLPSTNIASITKESVLKFLLDTTNVQNFVLNLTNAGGDTSTQTISKSASFVTIEESDISIDLTKADLDFGTRDMVAGTYTLQVLPVSDDYIDATPNECAPFTFTKAESVSEIDVKNGIISWNEISSNFGYGVIFNTSTAVCDINNYRPNSIKDINNFSVTVLGNDTNVINSDTYTPAPILRSTPITSYSLNQGVLHWSGEEGATYIVKYYQDDVFEKQEITNTNYYNKFTLSQKSRITVVKQIEGQFDSVESLFVNLSQLSGVQNINIVENSYRIAFDKIENNNGYQLDIVDAKGVKHSSIYASADLTSYNETQWVANLNTDYFIEGVNKIKITALGQSVDNTGSEVYYLSSVPSQIVDVEVLPQVKAKVENGVMTWTLASTTSPEGYRLTISKDQLTDASEDLIVDLPSVVKAGDYAWEELASGEYSVVMQAFAKENSNVIDGKTSTLTFSKISGTSLSVKNGEIVFNGVDGAVGYRVYMYDMDDTLVSDTVSSSVSSGNGKVVVNFDSFSANTEYKFAIKVLGGEYVNSNISSVRSVIKLDMVQDFTKVGGKLTWSNVLHNEGYILNGINGFAYNATLGTDVVQNSVPNSSFEDSGKYEITIVALGSSTTGASDIGYLNSEPQKITIVKLTDPSNIRLSDGVLYWGAYESITGSDSPLYAKIVVSMQDESDDFEYTCEQGVSINLYEKEELVEGSYSISVQFIGNENLILSSNIVKYNDGEFVSRIASANMTVNNGKIVFNKVENAKEYRVYVLSNAETDTYTLFETSAYVVKTGDVCEIVLNPSALVAGQNTTLKLMTIAEENSNFINSNLSAPLTVNKLTAISDLSINTHEGVSGRLTWTAVPNATSYVLLVSDGENTAEIAVSGQSTNYYDIADLPLTEGSYTVTIYAKGSATSGTGVGYLDSALSNSITITFVSDKISTKVEKGILSWNKVEGVQKYQLSISDGTNTVYRTISNSNDIVSYDLDKDSFVSDSSKDYVVCVVPLSLETSYYLVNTSKAITLTVNRALEVSELMVNEGLITWKVDISSLTMDQLLRAYDLFNKYKSNPDAFEETDEEKYTYEELYPYWNFIITINNTPYEIIPDKYTVGFDSTIMYYYEITDNVTSPTKYDVVVQSQGNKTCVDEDGNLILDGSDLPVAPTYLPSLPSETLTAYKSTVPAGIVSENGTIKFNMVTTVTKDGDDLVTNYVREYYLYGIPADGAVVLQWQIYVPDDHPEFAYVIDLKTLGADMGGNEITPNITYTYKICTCGTFSGDMNSGYTLNLRSNFYSPVSIAFLGQLDITYSDEDTTLGGIVKWGQNAISTDITHILYVMKESDAQAIGNTWWKDESVIKIDLNSEDSYFSFDDDKAKAAGIEGNTRYRVAVKYAGNNTTYIANGDNPSYVCVSTLKTVEFKTVGINKVYIQDGNFYWNPVDNCNFYKVMIYKLLADNSVKNIGPRYTSNNFFECDEFDDGQETLGYSIQITPLGQSREVNSEMVYFVNGYSNQPANAQGDRRYFEQLPKVTGLRVEYNDSGNLIIWDSNINASTYSVIINGVRNTESIYNNNSFYFNKDWGAGEYQISVKYNSGSTEKLNGLYCDPMLVKKMYEPQLHLENGKVVWSTNMSETLTSSSTKVSIYTSNAEGIIGTTPIESETIVDPTITSYNLSGNAGYYVVTVQFESREESEGVYQLSSSESKILVKKLSQVDEILNGVYKGNDCGYDNYVKWKVNEEAYAYKVELYNPQNEKILGDPYYYYVDPSTGLNDSEYFVLSNENPEYLCFNLKAMFAYGVSTVDVIVTAMGNTTEYSADANIVETLGYASSEPKSHTVSIPEAIPNLLSYDKGVIRWKGGAKYGDTINEKTVVNENSLAHNVEIVIVYASTYVFDAGTNTRDEVAVTEGISYTWEYSEGKDEVFYCPYITPGVQIKLRYYTTNSTSDYTPVFTITNNELFYAGTGTEEDPYMIYHDYNNNAELAKMFTNIQYRPTSHVVLMNDINMQGVSWTQIAQFDGHINAFGFTVSNLVVPNKLANGVNNSSLFNTIGENGIIERINFENISSVVDINNQNNTLNMAIITQNNYGQVKNLTIEGSAYGFAYKNLTFAGIAQNNYGKILGCNVKLNAEKDIKVSAGDITITGIYLHSNNKDAKIGGISINNYGTLENCAVESIIEAVSTGSNCAGYVGGITYSNNYVDENSKIYNCTVKNTTSIKANNIGGIAFENNADASILFSNAQAQINVIGYIRENGVSIQSVFSYFGGLVGRNKGNITSSFVFMDTINTEYNNKSNIYFGGLIGYNETYNDNTNTGKIKDSYVVVNTINHNSETPETRIGSIVGFVLSCAADDFTDLYENTPLTSISGGNAGNGDVSSSEVSSILYSDSGNANLIVAYILSGIDVDGSISEQNTLDYEELTVRFVINENYGLTSNTLPPYIIAA